MNRVIYKYALKGAIDAYATFPIDMPMGARILCVQLQDGVPTIWAQVEAASDVERRTLVIIGTGHPLRDNLRYIGTFQQGPFVWHLHESTSNLDP